MNRARLALVVAATLWSTSPLFMRALQKPVGLDLETPALSPLQIAFYRSFFAGLGLCLFLRPRHLSFTPSMLGMLLAFGTMTALFITAMGRGSSANAILLQNTAPVWVCLVGVVLFRDYPDRRTLVAILLGLIGALVIVVGNWPTDGSDQQLILLMATGSGFFYATVILFLRHLRDRSSAWLTVLNLLGGSIVIAAFGLGNSSDHLAWFTQQSSRQLAFLALYGCVQLAIPYVLFSTGLKTVSPQEAGIITLVEPVLNPLWAFLISPETDTPTHWTRCIANDGTHESIWPSVTFYQLN